MIEPMPKMVAVCVCCGLSWDDHLVLSKNRFLDSWGKDSELEMTKDELLMEVTNSVSWQDCITLLKRNGPGWGPSRA